MRYLRELSAVLAIGLGLASAPNVAGAVQPVSLRAPASLVQKVDYWHRYYRQHGYPPPPVVPVPVPVPPPALNPPVVMEVPLRPASCGEYHFWDGQACVDARFNKPYLGPVQSR